MRQSIEVPAKRLIGERPRVAIVRSSYYPHLVDELESAAREHLSSCGVPAGNIRSIAVPGAFEIPLACQKIAPAVDGIIAIGVIIQGETHHAEEIARGCTDGLMRVQIQEHIPIAHEVLFVDSPRQAEERCSGEKSRGREAAMTLLKMIAFVKT
jgi:6,7-dimethyl-8-ribityllumazine synthase